MCSSELIISPLDGVVSKIFNMSKELYVHSGQQLFEISPNGDLLAECSVLTKDIGYLSVNQPVRIQIDAFNYNQWGMIGGRISEIFTDVIISENQPYAYFRVNCSLDATKLYLKNGYEGDIRKGMSAQVLFIVTQRSIANLLYDKIDNWLNPNAN